MLQATNIKTFPHDQSLPNLTRPFLLSSTISFVGTSLITVLVTQSVPSLSTAHLHRAFISALSVFCGIQANPSSAIAADGEPRWDRRTRMAVAVRTWTAVGRREDCAVRGRWVASMESVLSDWAPVGSSDLVGSVDIDVRRSL